MDKPISREPDHGPLPLDLLIDLVSWIDIPEADHSHVLGITVTRFAAADGLDPTVAVYTGQAASIGGGNAEDVARLHFPEVQKWLLVPYGIGDSTLAQDGTTTITLARQRHRVAFQIGDSAVADLECIYFDCLYPPLCLAGHDFAGRAVTAAFSKLVRVVHRGPAVEMVPPPSGAPDGSRAFVMRFPGGAMGRSRRNPCASAQKPR